MNRYTSASNTPPFHTRSLAEQQTALNLSALARQAPDLSIDGLYKTLLVSKVWLQSSFAMRVMTQLVSIAD
jgi:hypothetical protein